MVIQRRTILTAVLVVAVVTTGCFGPGEEQATEPGDENGTTPGDTVEGGAQPNAEPGQTPTMFGTTTGQDTANETETTASATD